MSKKNKRTNFTKHQIMIAGILVFVIVVVTFGGSYAVFSDATESNEYNVINVGNFELSYVDLSEKGNVLTINNPYPVTDEIGSKGASYRFSVENTGSIKANYKIVITDDLDVIEKDNCKDKLVDKNNVRYKFNLEAPKTLQEIYNEEEKGYVMYTSPQPLNPGDSEIHEIRMWLNENSGNDVLGKHYHGKVNIILVQAEGLE